MNTPEEGYGFDEYNHSRSLDRIDRLSPNFEGKQFTDPEGYFAAASKPLLQSWKFKNCNMNGSRRAEVRLYLGKKQRILITTAWANIINALRFADCAVLYFWKYRKTLRLPEDSDFNFSLATAQKDFVDIQFVNQFLQDYEVRLTARGELPDATRKTEKLDLLPAMSKVNSLWNTLREYYTQVYFQCPITESTKLHLEISKEKIDELDKVFNSLTSVVKSAVGIEAKQNEKRSD